MNRIYIIADTIQTAERWIRDTNQNRLNVCHIASECSFISKRFHKGDMIYRLKGWRERSISEQVFEKVISTSEMLFGFDRAKGIIDVNEW